MNFHLNDSELDGGNRDHPDFDKLHKVRPIIDHVKKFPELYTPHREMAVDGAMIKFKGRCSFFSTALPNLTSG